MSEIIERMARAMSVKDKGADNWEVMSEDGDGYGYVGKNEYRTMARIAFEVMQNDLLEYAKSFPFEDVRRPVLEELWQRNEART